jgi:hypothetical protein
MDKYMTKTREGVEQARYRYSDADIEKANSISIIDWVSQQGYPIKDERRWAEIKGQAGLTIDKINNRWYCHSQKIGGGPIQLLMYLQDLSWSEAVLNLIGENVAYQVMNNRPIIPDQSKENFKLPEKNDSYKHIYAYLVKSRKIHPDIINEFVKKKLIYENTKKSCVFVGTTKDGIPKYANIRSTNTLGEPFKGEAALSDKRFGFARAGTNNVLTIMEAPIDLLSYMTIFKNHSLSHLIENDHLLSLGGVNDIALIQYLEDHPEITKIKLGLDNDKTGNEACERIFHQYSKQYAIERIQIREKDFNEALIKDIEKQQLKQAMQLQQANNLQYEEELEPV